MPTAGRNLLHGTSTLCSTTSRYNVDDDKIDDKIAIFLHNYLKGRSNFLPSDQLLEKIVASSGKNSAISLGYGIEVTRDFALTAIESYKGVLCTIKISPDEYSAYARGKDINLRKYPIYDLMNILVVQRFLAKAKEKFAPKKIR